MRALAVPGARRRRLRQLAGLSVTPDTRARVTSRALSLLDRRPRMTALYAGVSCALAVGAATGPIGALAAGAYSATVVVLAGSVRRSRAQRRATASALDLVAAIAADLRAGADPEATVAAVLPELRLRGRHGAVLANRVGAACRVADAVGARLADLLDRLEADARALSKAETTAAAQAAGAQATAWLLAGLPLAGLALGYGIGADPVGTLLHTRIGAACATAAIALQILGVAWSQRLTRSIRESVR